MKKNVALQVANLNVRYNGASVLSNVSFSIPYGMMCAIVGCNGVGKSTLLKTIISLVAKQSGTIEIGGKSAEKMLDSIAYLPQRQDVDWDFPATVEDIVMMGRYRHIGWFSRPRQNDYYQVDIAIEKLGLQDLKKKPLRLLSGGQQQRVFVARALAQEAQVYLLDEPFVGIDKQTEHILISVLHALRDEGKSIILVHHDVQTLVDYFDWIIFLEKNNVRFGPVSQLIVQEKNHPFIPSYIFKQLSSTTL